MDNKWKENSPEFLKIMAELKAIMKKHMPTGEHSHKCPECGHVWAHEDNCLNDAKAHTCKCGVEQWYVFENGRSGGEWQSCVKGDK
jgi:predicted RNA-binding Zn-ribbon protein involved in translation (DUF1610 family)